MLRGAATGDAPKLKGDAHIVPEDDDKARQRRRAKQAAEVEAALARHAAEVESLRAAAAERRHLAANPVDDARDEVLVRRKMLGYHRAIERLTAAEERGGKYIAANKRAAERAAHEEHMRQLEEAAKVQKERQMRIDERARLAAEYEAKQSKSRAAFNLPQPAGLPPPPLDVIFARLDRELYTQVRSIAA